MNEEERIVCPGVKEEDTEEISLRPKWLNEYTGQEKVKENLKVFIEASKNQNANVQVFFDTKK